MNLRPVPTALGLVLAATLAAEDWSRFRGPNGSGIAPDTGYPVEFGPNQNCLWRTPARPGKSSPVLTARHVFFTAHEKGKLYTQCFDRQTGKLLWERAEDRPRQEDVNPLNNPAAITPVTDGENVYVFFKDYGLVSYDAAGAVRWKVPMGPFSSSMGLGASPILAGNSLVVLADQRENSYLAAFDARNGETRWKIGRDERESWGTPLLLERAGSATQIITASRGLLGGHSLGDGKRSFTHPEIATTIVASPVVADDTIYVFGYGSEAMAPYSGPLERFDKNHDRLISPEEYGSNPVMNAIGKYVGNGDLTVTEEKWAAWQRAVVGPNRLSAVRMERDPGDHAGRTLRPRELWRYDKSFTGVIPSPLLYQGVLYVVKNGGILTSLDAATGKELKIGRVQGALGGYSASPVAAEGRLYVANEEGKVAVLRAGGDWDVLQVNDLGEGCFATPALSGGRIYLRTTDALYCFAAGGADSRRRPGGIR
jgi:outer membrane protein assembly factor BamB